MDDLKRVYGAVDETVAITNLDTFKCNNIFYDFTFMAGQLGSFIGLFQVNTLTKRKAPD
jgi:hypothetical protein